MISIIILTYGSEDKVRENTEIFDSILYGESFELIFINDNRGKGSAIKNGLEKAQGKYIIIIDGDLQINPQDIKTMFKIMELYNADAVVGNKRHPYSIVEYTVFRQIVSNCYNLLVKLLFGFQLRDSQCGLKLFKGSVIKKVMHRVLCKQYAFDIELLVTLRDNGFRIADSPVFVKKQTGKGSVGFKSVLNTLKDTLAVWYRRRIGWYKMWCEN